MQVLKLEGSGFAVFFCEPWIRLCDSVFLFLFFCLFVLLLFFKGKRSDAWCAGTKQFLQQHLIPPSHHSWHCFSIFYFLFNGGDRFILITLHCFYLVSIYVPLPFSLCCLLLDIF